MRGCVAQTTAGTVRPSKQCWTVGYCSYNPRCLRVATSSYMLRNVREFFEMWQPNNLEHGRCRRWWAAVVVLAVCSLTVSVATRYTFSRGLTETRTVSVRSHASPELSRQRLLKNAATWMPPVVASEVVCECSAYPRIAPGGPPIPNIFYEESLFNRPPPSISL